LWSARICSHNFYMHHFGTRHPVWEPLYWGIIS
jgi:hypothetical protein